jgi:hypothetical protein
MRVTHQSSVPINASSRDRSAPVVVVSPGMHELTTIDGGTPTDAACGTGGRRSCPRDVGVRSALAIEPSTARHAR